MVGNGVDRGLWLRGDFDVGAEFVEGEAAGEVVGALIAFAIEEEGFTVAGDEKVVKEFALGVEEAGID